MSNQSTEQIEELTTEQKKFQFRVLLNEVLSKLEEAKDTATELDHAYQLDIDIDDLEEVITAVQNLCNTADGTNDEDIAETID